MFNANVSYGGDGPRTLAMTCQDYSWSDVEVLVRPYLDDALYAALVMQGESANYKISDAAIQAMDESLPEVINRILQALINAGC
jgi:hypothetical protein